MNPENTRRAIDLFKRALPLSPDDRRRVLHEVCGRDDELRREVEGMLDVEEAGRHDETILAGRRILVEAVADVSLPDRPPLPSRVGQYTAQKLLGEGGMGLVYEAVQDHPRRSVALKILRPGAVTSERRQRFEREAEALGRLRHPGIAQVFEAGTVMLGGEPHPFLAMELVEGVSILEHVERSGLSNAERMDLLARVADAVQHAHERGVVHRDLKPENILIDPSGQPKILDFGVAHISAPDGSRGKALTLSGELVGTIAFMSPEQLGGDHASVTAVSDVYSLGVLTYELLAGRLPIPVDGHPLPEAIRLAQTSEPELLGALDPRLRGDPESIAAKALEKDATRRYRSAGELADDLRRALRHEPIVARRSTVLYQLRKLVRRHRGLVASVGAVLLSLVAGVVLFAMASNRATHAAALANRQLYRTAISAANYALNLQGVASARTHLDTVDQEHRGWEWHHVNRQLEPWLFDYELGAKPLGRPAYVDGGNLVATALDDGTVAICEPKLGRFVRALDAGTELYTLSRTQPAGRLVAGTSDGRVLVWDLASGERSVLSTGTEGPVADLDTAADGTVVALTAGRAVVVGPGVSPRTIEGLNPWVWSKDVSFSPDGTHLAVLESVPGTPTRYEANVGLYDVSTGKRVALAEWAGIPNSLAFSPDGSILAVGNRQRDILLLEADTLTPIADMLGHSGEVASVAFVPDGTRIISSATDGTLRVWSVEERKTLGVLRHGWGRSLVAVDPSGECVTAASPEDGAMRAWALDTMGPTVFRGHDSYVYSAEFSPLGDLIASAGFRDVDRTIRLWDPIAGESVGTLLDTSGGSSAVFSSDGRRMVFRPRESGHPRAVDILTGELLAHDHPERAAPVEFIRHAPEDQEWLQCLRDLVGSKHARVAQTVFSEGDELVVSRPDASTIVVRRGIGGPVLARLHGNQLDRNPELSPDGRLVASGSIDHGVYVWDWRASAEPLRLRGHAGAVYEVRFNPDGSRLATGGNDNRILLWDTETWEPMLELLGHESYVYRLDWSPDGTQLVSASGDLTVRLWDSLPVATRHRQALEASHVRELIRPVVDALWKRNPDPRAVLQALTEDRDLTVAERAAAERLLLQKRLGL